MYTDQNTNRKIIIAIDGFSSCGKSTFAKAIARRLGYIFIDTGAMYRAVTFYALEHGAIRSGMVDEDAVVRLLPEICIDFRFNPERGASDIYVNGDRVEGKIRTIEVSNCVSAVSSIGAVRSKLVAMQQEMGRKRGIVMDGRDIGTTVFPDAELKIFMTADPSGGAGAETLRRVDGQRRTGLLRRNSAERPVAGQGRHGAGYLSAAQGRRRRCAGQQPDDRRGAVVVVRSGVPARDGAVIPRRMPEDSCRAGGTGKRTDRSGTGPETLGGRRGCGKARRRAEPSGAMPQTAGICCRG